MSLLQIETYDKGMSHISYFSFLLISNYVCHLESRVNKTGENYCQVKNQKMIHSRNLEYDN